MSTAGEILGPCEQHLEQEKRDYSDEYCAIAMALDARPAVA